MAYSSIITPKVANGFVSRQTNLGVDSYDLNELYSPDTELWKSKVLDLGSSKYPPQVATAPTRYWFDRSRYNNHGAITGATWKQLPSGVWVMSFDGGDDQINCGNNSILNFTSEPFTIVAWWKPTSLAAQGALLNRGAYQTDGYYVLLRTYNCIDFVTAQSGVGQSTTSTSIITAGNWYHLAFVRLGSNVDIFINGTEATLFHGTHIDPATSTRNLIIGNYTTSWANGTIGKVLFLRGYTASAEFIRQYYLRTKWRYQ